MAVGMAISASACVHEFPFRQGEVDENTIVIEGYITNEYMHHTVQISRLSSYEDTVRNMLKGAYVAVSSGDSTYYYNETEDGIYTSETKFVGVAGNVYFLHVRINDSTIISAESRMLPVTPPEKITFKSHPDGNRSIGYIAEAFVSENPAKYVVQVNWTDHSSEEPRRANLYYYSLTTVDISQLFAPKVQETRFPSGAQLIERKYSIDKNYETYLRSLLAEQLWSGGYFDEAHGNLHTNLICNRSQVKTAGYFSANTVYIDTLVVE